MASLIIAFAILYLLDRFPDIDFQSRVSVTDGDSFRRGKQRIRLFGIDAPELAQECLDAKGRPYACGQAAKRALQELIGGAEISCEVVERDKYRRDVARCRKDDLEINREMVRLGWALAYERHSIDYLVAEKRATRDEASGKGIFRRLKTFGRSSATRSIAATLANPHGWKRIDAPGGGSSSRRGC